MKRKQFPRRRQKGRQKTNYAVQAENKCKEVYKADSKEKTRNAK